MSSAEPKQTETKYLIFRDEEIPGTKTKVYAVLSKSRKDPNQSGVLERELEIGMIKWYHPWRRYVFYPDKETLFDTICLNDISSFIQQMMMQR